MITVTIQQAKSSFSKIIEQVESGEEVVITRDKVAVARIVPARKRKRKLAIFKGKFRVGPEFFGPLPDDELRAWHFAGK